MYCPSAVSFHEMESCEPGSRWMSCTRFHRCTSCWICWVVMLACRSRSEIQQSLSRASLTLRFFLLEMAKMVGAKSFGRQPPIHAEFQKSILVPSPTVIEVAAAKRSLSVSSHGFPSPIHALFSDFHSCHSHLIRSALAKFSKLRMPRPPSSFDIQVLVQLTLHFPRKGLVACPKKFFPLAI